MPRWPVQFQNTSCKIQLFSFKIQLFSFKIQLFSFTIPVAKYNCMVTVEATTGGSPLCYDLLHVTGSLGKIAMECYGLWCSYGFLLRGWWCKKRWLQVLTSVDRQPQIACCPLELEKIVRRSCDFSTCRAGWVSLCWNVWKLRLSRLFNGSLASRPFAVSQAGRPPPLRLIVADYIHSFAS